MKTKQLPLISRWLRPIHDFVAQPIERSGLKIPKKFEDAIEASVVVLAVFAWIAAMTLLP